MDNLGMNSANTNELMVAQQQVKVLTQRLNEATASMGAWVFTAQGEVYVESVGPDRGVQFRMTFKKGNGDGFQRIITPQQLQYFANSPDSLVVELVDEIYHNFYRETIKNRITSLVAQGIKNASLMELTI